MLWLPLAADSDGTAIIVRIKAALLRMCPSLFRSSLSLPSIGQVDNKNNVNVIFKKFYLKFEINNYYKYEVS
jgi:hypothetical protein